MLTYHRIVNALSVVLALAIALSFIQETLPRLAFGAAFHLPTQIITLSAEAAHSFKVIFLPQS